MSHESFTLATAKYGKIVINEGKEEEQTIQLESIGIKVYINETRFPNTLHSPKIQEVRQAKRSQDLLALAKEKMPELKAPKK